MAGGANFNEALNKALKDCEQTQERAIVEQALNIISGVILKLFDYASDQDSGGDKNGQKENN